MLVLFETPAGHALFRLKKPEKLQKAEDLHSSFADLDSANKMCATCPRSAGRLSPACECVS